MDRREAERGRALVAAALAAQDEYDRAQSATTAARGAADKARADLAAWVGANGAGKTLVFDGQVVSVGGRVDLVPLVALDPPPLRFSPVHHAPFTDELPNTTGRPG